MMEKNDKNDYKSNIELTQPLIKRSSFLPTVESECDALISKSMKEKELHLEKEI